MEGLMPEDKFSELATVGLRAAAHVVANTALPGVGSRIVTGLEQAIAIVAGNPDGGWRAEIEDQTANELRDFRERITAAEAEIGRLNKQVAHASPMNLARLVAEVLEALPQMQSEEGKRAIKNAVARRAVYAAGSARTSIEWWWKELRELSETQLVLVYQLGRDELENPGKSRDYWIHRSNAPDLRLSHTDDERQALSEAIGASYGSAPALLQPVHGKEHFMKLSARGVAIWNLLKDPPGSAGA